MWAITALGWLIGRFPLLGAGAETVLARLVFFVAAPALMFETLATTPLAGVFTGAAVPFIASTAVVALAAAVTARRRWRLRRGEATVATMCASYVNAGYLGIPIAGYVLGDVAYAVPVLLVQVLVYTPLAMVLLDEGRGLRSLALLPLRTPLVPACLAGLAVAVIGVTPPEAVIRPVSLVGSAAIPLALLALGLSLGGARPFRGGPGAEPRYTMVVAKVLIQPTVAYAVARLIGLEGALLLAAVVMSGLPTAQNVFVFATRFGRAAGLARDAVVLSTLLAAASLLLITLWLG